MKKSFIFAALSGMFLLSAADVQASGFGVKLNSAQLAGQSFAGSAVSADPLAAFNNPASTILAMSHEAAIHGTVVIPNAKFRSDAGEGSKNGAKTTFVPSGAFTAKINDCWRFNINVSAPFGLRFDYGDNAIPENLRNYVIKAEMMTTNINPNIAYRANDVLTLGLGLQAMYADVTLRSRVAAAPTVISEVKGDKWGYGFTAGVLLDLTKALKVGLSYRSQVKTNLQGDLKFDTQAGILQNTPASAKILFPSTVTLSASLDLSPKWTLLGDLVSTRWHTVDSIQILAKNNALLNKTLTQNWEDRIFVSLGVNYKHSDAWLFRAGLAYDKSPTRNDTRLPAIPDTDKTWLSVGATYNMNAKSSLTLSYGHEFFKKGRIEQVRSSALSADALTGRVKSHVDLIGIQFNHKI